jgi:hypothetical protein
VQNSYHALVKQRFSKMTKINIIGQICNEKQNQAGQLWIERGAIKYRIIQIQNWNVAERRNVGETSAVAKIK